MKTSSFTLIPSTTFGTAVGNYDGVSPDFSGVPAKAAAYYSKDKSLQTISWYLVGVEADITVEATLDANSDSTNYFPIHTFNAATLTENDFINIEGNYTWIRITITNFTAGTFNKISLGY